MTGDTDTLTLVVKMLPVITGAGAIDLIEELALTVAARDDELRAARELVSATLALAHAQHVEILRLRADRRSESRAA